MGKSKKRKQIAWIAAGTAAFLVLAYWSFGSGPSQKPVLEAAAVEFGDLTVELPATGIIDAVNVVDVGSPVSGRIQEIHTDFNQRVKAGQLLAVMEEDDYRATYLQAEADLSAARAAVETEQADLQYARDDQSRVAAEAQRAQALYDKLQSDLERNKQLVAAGLVTTAVYEQVQNTYEQAKADLAAAKAQIGQSASKLKSAQASLEQARATVDQRAARAAAAKKNLDYCRIVSPVDGVVVSRNVDVGQTVAARLEAPSLFNIAQDLSHMYVYAKLDSSDVAKVHPGLHATFTVNAFPRDTFEGALVQVRINANAPSPISRTAAVGGQFQRTLTAGSASGSPLDGSQTASSTSTGSTSALAALTGASKSSGGGGGSSSGSSGGGGGSSSSSTPSNSASSAPAAGNMNTVVTYDALIEFSNPEEKLLPGMTAYVTIPIASVKSMLKVPAAALRFSPDIPADQKQQLIATAGLTSNDSMVWIVTGEKSERKYRPVRVKALLTDYVMTAVEAPDLKPGMQVATRIVPPPKVT